MSSTYLDLYHRTTAERAQEILASGSMRSKEASQDAFFSTHPDSPSMLGYGPVVVRIRVPADWVNILDRAAATSGPFWEHPAEERQRVADLLGTPSVEVEIHNAADDSMKATSTAGPFLALAILNEVAIELIARHSAGSVGREEAIFRSVSACQSCSPMKTSDRQLSRGRSTGRCPLR